VYRKDTLESEFVININHSYL